MSTGIGHGNGQRKRATSTVNPANQQIYISRFAVCALRLKSCRWASNLSYSESHCGSKRATLVSYYPDKDTFTCHTGRWALSKGMNDQEV